jgi:hypothetical protein
MRPALVGYTYTYTPCIGFCHWEARTWRLEGREEGIRKGMEICWWLYCQTFVKGKEARQRTVFFLCLKWKRNALWPEKLASSNQGTRPGMWILRTHVLVSSLFSFNLIFLSLSRIQKSHFLVLFSHL